MKNIISVLLILVVFTTTAHPQIPKYSDNGTPYLEHYIGENYPLVIYLHGSGQSGNGTIATLDKLKTVPFFTKFFNENKTKFNILAPQYPSTQSGFGELGNKFFDFVRAKYKYDGRDYLTGHSAGGKGTMSICAYLYFGNKPLPTAVAVIAGESDYKATWPMAGKLVARLYVGDKDNTITSSDGKTIYQKMQSMKNWLYGDKYAGENWKVFPGVGHGSDNNAYSSSEKLADWFLSNGKPKDPVPEPPVNPVDSILGGGGFLRNDTLFIIFKSGLIRPFGS